MIAKNHLSIQTVGPQFGCQQPTLTTQQTLEEPTARLHAMCCNFLRYSVFLMLMVQLTCWCPCWRCLIHDIWIIKARLWSCCMLEAAAASFRFAVWAFGRATLFELPLLCCVNPVGSFIIHSSDSEDNLTSTPSRELEKMAWERCYCQIMLC